MTKLILAALLIATSTGARADSILPKDVPRVRFSLDPFYHQQGFRLGHILNYARDIFWNYEGQLMLGFGSSPAIIYSQSCLADSMPQAESVRDPNARATAIASAKRKCTVDRNPWPFSALNPKLYAQYTNSGAGPVVMYYEREARRSEELLATGRAAALWTNTRNYVSKIWAPNPSLKIPPTYPSGKVSVPLADAITYQSNTTEGRIVKASMDGAYLKTYEITIQEGSLGSNFKLLSVTDAKMFDYLVATMLADKIVRLTYVDLFNIETDWERLYPGYTTPLRVLRAQTL